MNNEDVIIHSDWIRQQHPDWTKDQADLQAVLNSKADDFIADGKDITDQVIELIIRQARIWIERNLPALMEKVKGFFDYILDNLGDWIMKGLGYLSDLISDFF